MAFDSAHAPLINTVDPLGPHVAASCFEFLLIELVPLAYRMAEQQAARDAATEPGAAWTVHGRRAGKSRAAAGGAGTAAAVTAAQAAGGGATALLAGGPVAPVSQDAQTVVSVTTGAGVGVGGIGGSVDGLDEEETREAVFWRLDALGYRVGLSLVDRFAKDKPRFTDTLDVIKFLCKDLWTLVFRKQIDNLKTNHRGIYVLTDNSFRPLSKMSMERGRDSQTMMAQAQPFLYFPAGVIRGALASMGIVATVQAESPELPGASFQIRTQAAK